MLTVRVAQYSVLHTVCAVLVFYDRIHNKMLARHKVEFICRSCQGHYEAPSPGGTWHRVPHQDGDIEQQVLLKDAVMVDDRAEAGEGDGEVDRLLSTK